MHFPPPAEAAPVNVIDAGGIVEFLRESRDEILQFRAEDGILDGWSPKTFAARARLRIALGAGVQEPADMRVKKVDAGLEIPDFI
jgi:hypothetical protein